MLRNTDLVPVRIVHIGQYRPIPSRTAEVLRRCRPMYELHAGTASSLRLILIISFVVQISTIVNWAGIIHEITKHREAAGPVDYYSSIHLNRWWLILLSRRTPLWYLLMKKSYTFVVPVVVFCWPGTLFFWRRLMIPGIATLTSWTPILNKLNRIRQHATS